MAVKDHTLDEPIMEAAKADFLEWGYEKASMRRIAEKAGVTHGALYTRFRGKDELFRSLVSPLIDSIIKAFGALKSEYFTEEDMRDPSSFVQTMRKENMTITGLLFDDYERSTLLLTKSTGSSLGMFFDKVIEEKISTTLEFFRERGMECPDQTVLRLLLKAEFGMFREVIASGCTREHALEIMESVMTYHEAGWRALLHI